MTIDIQAIRGVTNQYGVRVLNPEYGGRIDEKVIKTVQWTFDYSNLPEAGLSNLEAVIPANASILSAKMQIIEAFTSTSTTTDLTVGLVKKDGTGGDPDGLLTAVHASQTTIAVVGAILDGASGTAGAYINNTIGTTPLELVVAPSVADLLTGKARLIVQYLDQGL